jgi:hypothetical protein
MAFYLGFLAFGGWCTYDSYRVIKRLDDQRKYYEVRTNRLDHECDELKLKMDKLVLDKERICQSDKERIRREIILDGVEQAKSTTITERIG